LNNAHLAESNRTDGNGVGIGVGVCVMVAVGVTLGEGVEPTPRSSGRLQASIEIIKERNMKIRRNRGWHMAPIIKQVE
jgi:hypothetical protein